MDMTKEHSSDVAATAPVLPSLGQFDPETSLAAIPNLKDYAKAVARAIHGVVLKGGLATRWLADLLHGTWLGHPLHPLLTDFTISAWSFGSFLDLVGLSRRSRPARRAADVLIGTGVLLA